MQNLTKWIEEHGRSQDWLAKQIDLTPGAVSHWITGRHKPGLAHLAAISDVTGLTIDQLLDRE